MTALTSFDASKKGVNHSRLLYRLENVDVYVDSNDFHFIEYIDPVENVDEVISENHYDSEVSDYLNTQLQFNKKKFITQVSLVSRLLCSPRDKKVLDVGCGGGLFLQLMRDKGFSVMGIELSDPRAYHTSLLGIEVIKKVVEDPFWSNYEKSFDAVTLWDVIEHVNYPEQTLSAAAALVSEGGYIIVDTPCRDSFLYRFGEFTYALSRGRFPTFLSLMYSPHPYGHKQILSKRNLREMALNNGLVVEKVMQFHELSFPIDFYLEKLIPFIKNYKSISRFFASTILRVFPLKNKMLLVARRPALGCIPCMSYPLRLT